MTTTRNLLFILTLLTAAHVSRATSITHLLNKKYQTLALSDPFYQAFGQPESTGVWFIYAASTSGKTSFIWQLIKELAPNDKIAYNSREEGTAQTLQDVVKRTGLSLQERRQVVIINEDFDELMLRIAKRKSPRIIIIDSVQYMTMNWLQYLELKEAAAGKLLIIVSQTEGNKPAGRTAARIQFDAGLKIWVLGFRAFSKGRYYGPLGYYDIWPEQAAIYHGGASPQNPDTDAN